MTPEQLEQERLAFEDWLQTLEIEIIPEAGFDTNQKKYKSKLLNAMYFSWLSRAEHQHTQAAE